MSRRILLATVAAAGCLLGSSLAQAAGGCGVGYHPNGYGNCVPNGPVGGPGCDAAAHMTPGGCVCNQGAYRNGTGHCVY